MADNTNRVAGIISVAIDGQSYAVAGQATYSPGSVTREPAVGQDGVHGYKELPRAATMGMSLRDTGGLVVGDLQNITYSTIVFSLANGKTVVGSNMFLTGDPPDVDTEESKMDAKFASAGTVTEY